jgi:hypothetical protein
MACHREWKNFLGKRAQKPVGIIKELQEFARCDNFRKRLPQPINATFTETAGTNLPAVRQI